MRQDRWCSLPAPMKSSLIDSGGASLTEECGVLTVNSCVFIRGQRFIPRPDWMPRTGFRSPDENGRGRSTAASGVNFIAASLRFTAALTHQPRDFFFFFEVSAVRLPVVRPTTCCTRGTVVPVGFFLLQVPGTSGFPVPRSVRILRGEEMVHFNYEYRYSTLNWFEGSCAARRDLFGHAR